MSSRNIGRRDHHESFFKEVQCITKRNQKSKKGNHSSQMINQRTLTNDVQKNHNLDKKSKGKQTGEMVKYSMKTHMIGAVI